MAPGSIHPRTSKLYQEATPWRLELLNQCPVYDSAWLPCSENKPTKTTVSVPAAIGENNHDELIAEIGLAVEERVAMARRYLESVPGTQQGNGADSCCTALTMKMLFGFALPAENVLGMLTEWGQRNDQIDDAGGWYLMPMKSKSQPSSNGLVTTLFRIIATTKWLCCLAHLVVATGRHWLSCRPCWAGAMSPTRHWPHLEDVLDWSHLLVVWRH